jgi:hypothetical protein
MSEPLASLVKKIDEKVIETNGKYAPKRKLGTFVIMADANGRADQLRDLAKSRGIERVNLCIGAAPQRYDVNPAADITIVVYRPDRPGRQVVTANFALHQSDLDDCKAAEILDAVEQVLPK